jgi:hypothetical protein
VELTRILNAVTNNDDTELINMFDEILNRKSMASIQQWAEQTKLLGDKVYFMSCFYTYSEADFDKWFKELNNFSLSLGAYDSASLLKHRSQIKKNFLENKEVFERHLNIKYLQHNQVGALALVYDFIEKHSHNSNLFIKIGTGQGKSLAIAETVRHIILKNRRGIYYFYYYYFNYYFNYYYYY